MADAPNNSSKFSFLKKSLPWLGTIAGVFVPGAAPLINAATKIVGDKLGKQIAPDANSLADALQAALGDPAQHAQLLEAEQAYKQAMQQMGYQHEGEMEEIAEKDRDSARNREIQVRDRTPEIGFYTLIIGVALIVVALFKIPIPADNKAVVFTIVGSITGLLTAAGAYFYGANRNNQRATELLAQAPAIQK